RRRRSETVCCPLRKRCTTAFRRTRARYRVVEGGLWAGHCLSASAGEAGGLVAAVSGDGDRAVGAGARIAAARGGTRLDRPGGMGYAAGLPPGWRPGRGGVPR